MKVTAFAVLIDTSQQTRRCRKGLHQRCYQLSESSSAVNVSAAPYQCLRDQSFLRLGLNNRDRHARAAHKIVATGLQVKHTCAAATTACLDAWSLALRTTGLGCASTMPVIAGQPKIWDRQRLRPVRHDQPWLAVHSTVLHGPDDTTQATVFVCANLDSAYFVLLDHSLTCRWTAPPVPPPHDYFVAVAAQHPGAPHDGRCLPFFLDSAASPCGRFAPAPVKTAPSA